MKTTRRSFIWLALVALMAPWLGAAVAYTQAHDGSGTLRLSSRYQPNGSDYDQFVWDSFSVAQATAVTEIRWRGGYTPGMAYWDGTIANFHISIYESTPGLGEPFLGPGYPGTPATLVAYDTGDAAGELPAGTFGGVPLFDYHFVLPTVFQAAAGKVYWVQIEAEFVGGIPSWGLAAGAGNGYHFRRIAGGADFYFQLPPGDAAFSIVAADGPIRTIAAVASPEGSGVIAGDGFYPDQAIAPLVAIPNPGFAFVSWTEAAVTVANTAAYSFTVSADRSLVANFAPGSLITLVAEPATGGTVDGAGSHVDGSTVTVEAQPAANFRFVRWQEGGVTVSTAALYSFTAGGDRSLVAEFTAAAVNPGLVFNQPAANSGTLLNSSYLAPDGNVDGMEYRYERFQLAATQAISEVRWRGGYAGNNRAANPVTDFVITILGSTANGFYPDFATGNLKKWQLSGPGNETAGPVIGGVQLYDYSVTLPTSFQAQAGVYYWIQIEAWQHGYPLTWGHATGLGGNGSHYRRIGNSYYSATGDLALALRSDVPTTHTVTASTATPARGSVVGGGVYANGAQVNLLATAVAGYVFVNWSENGAVAGSSPTLSFAAAADRTLVAVFQPSFNLTLTSSSTGMGTVSGGGAFVVGSTVNATATPNPGYVFVGWTEGGAELSKSAVLPVTLAAARSLVGVFASGFTLAATPSFNPGGTISGAGGYATGAAVTLTARPAPGYAFAGWTEGGVEVPSGPILSLAASANRTFTAQFMPILNLGAGPDTTRLAWPANAAGWRLFECTDLRAGIWTETTLPPSTTDGMTGVDAPPPTGAPVFYRLQGP